MLSTCFKNYIGIRGTCDDVAPISSLFINDLAGISLKMISNLSNEEQQSFQGVWDEIYQRSLNELEGDILVKMQRFFRTNILLENQLTGRYITPHLIEPASNHLKGIYISIRESKNTELFINDIELFLGAAVSGAEIFIYDANDGTLLDTIIFNATAGFNNVPINKKYSIKGQRKRLFVSYNGNIADTIETNPIAIDTKVGFANVQGARIPVGQAVLRDNLEFTGNTHGMVINFNVVCSLDNFICSMRDFFKTALWYKLEENIMLERLTTERINKYTMVNKEKAEELRELYREKYESNLEAVLDNLEPEGDDLCFPCEKKRTYAYNLQ